MHGVARRCGAQRRMSFRRRGNRPVDIKGIGSGSAWRYSFPVEARIFMHVHSGDWRPRGALDSRHWDSVVIDDIATATVIIVMDSGFMVNVRGVAFRQAVAMDVPMVE